MDIPSDATLAKAELTLQQYQELLTEQKAAGKCTFFIGRSRRFCRKHYVPSSSTSQSYTCFDHEPKHLEKIRKETFKKKEEQQQAPKVPGAKPKRTRISSSQKRMINPLGIKFQVPRQAPAWESVYADETRPLLVDVGCARGKLLQGLAREYPNAFNYMGVEIRPALVQAANAEATKDHDAKNLFYVSCNINVSTMSLLGQQPDKPTPPVGLICIQFPDPWKRKKHKRRRILSEQFVNELSVCLGAGSLVYVCSDVLDVAEEMRHHLNQSEHFELYDLPTPTPSSSSSSSSSSLSSSSSTGVDSLDPRVRLPALVFSGAWQQAQLETATTNTIATTQLPSPATTTTTTTIITILKKFVGCGGVAAAAAAGLVLALATGRRPRAGTAGLVLALVGWWLGRVAERKSKKEAQQTACGQQGNNTVQQHGWLYDEAGWLKCSPLPLPSEREHVCEVMRGRPVYRALFIRNSAVAVLAPPSTRAAAPEKLDDDDDDDDNDQDE